MMMGKDEEVLCGCGCRLRAISRKQTLKHFSERKKFSDRARVKFSCKGIAFAIVAFLIVPRTLLEMDLKDLY
jgi:hypothetical protein